VVGLAKLQRWIGNRIYHAMTQLYWTVPVVTILRPSLFSRQMPEISLGILLYTLQGLLLLQRIIFTTFRTA